MENGQKKWKNLDSWKMPVVEHGWEQQNITCIIESQNGWGWKGLLEIIESNPLALRSQYVVAQL